APAPTSQQTDTQRGTCSCPSFLLSRFLICKHIVLDSSFARIGDDSADAETFWFDAVQRFRAPPFWRVPAEVEQRREAKAKGEVAGREVWDLWEEEEEDAGADVDVWAATEGEFGGGFDSGEEGGGAAEEGAAEAAADEAGGEVSMGEAESANGSEGQSAGSGPLGEKRDAPPADATSRVHDRLARLLAQYTKLVGAKAEGGVDPRWLEEEVEVVEAMIKRIQVGEREVGQGAFATSRGSQKQKKNGGSSAGGSGGRVQLPSKRWG
ncbi:hypothetical protein JCM6882_008537, partial [Rhodosporidiobolus microsporus]